MEEEIRVNHVGKRWGGKKETGRGTDLRAIIFSLISI